MERIKVKNIDHSDWKDHKYMVIRDCRNETGSNYGFWYWGSYDNLSQAHQEAKELCNGVLVETKDVNKYE